VLIFGVFTLLGVRLWSLQLLNGKHYTQQAANNRIRTSTTAATRGRIFDRNGTPLVVNRSSMAVVAPAYIQGIEDKDKKPIIVDRLASVLHMTESDILSKLNNYRDAPLDPHIIAIDVTMEQAAYISEHATLFPNVSIQATSVQQYPQGALAAQVLGYTGEISDSELNSSRYKGYQASDIVGKTGAEWEFENALQGVRGASQMEVDAYGMPKKVLSSTSPQSGEDVRLTIEAKLQKSVEQSLAEAMTTAQAKGAKNGKASSAVVLNVRTGEILAMASLPSYNPSLFVGGISTKAWAQLTAKNSGYPLTNRAIAALYPPASCFKSFVALAALNDGLATANTTYDCQGHWFGLGSQWGKWCWDHYGHGELNMTQAITESCDVYFYNVGKSFYEKGGKNGTLLQDYVKKFDFGSATGVDLPGEADGRVPTPAWKAAFNSNYPELKGWVPGDEVNMAIGQGDMLATPLQMAVAYSAIANNGVVMTPHVLDSISNNEGKTVYTYKPQQEKTQPKVSASSLATLHTALEDVTTASNGTAHSAFRTYQTPVAGKTGTAQVLGKDDYGWFVGYAPANDPQYCVAVMIEQAGESSVTAPAARQIFEALFGQKVEHIVANDTSR